MASTVHCTLYSTRKNVPVHCKQQSDPSEVELTPRPLSLFYSEMHIFHSCVTYTLYSAYINIYMYSTYTGYTFIEHGVYSTLYSSGTGTHSFLQIFTSPYSTVQCPTVVQ